MSGCVRAANLIREKKYLDVAFDVLFAYHIYRFWFHLLPYIPKIDPDRVTGLVNIGKYLL